MSFLPFFLILLSSFLQGRTFAAKKSYIVYLGGYSNQAERLLTQPNELVRETHVELLESHLKSKENAKDAIFYSYTRHINGFAAILDEEVALAISNSPGVISVFENKKYKLHTTRSWQFLGLERDGNIPQELWEKAKFGEDVIIGNIDTGVWPESESFRDEDMGPIPSRWKGICQKENDTEFSCNRKLIGTRSFFKTFEYYFGKLSSDLRTPRDTAGHGTHTLSTAGGSPVHGANVLGFGNGTAKGGSPRARVASYKACWPSEEYGSWCFYADILAAFDAAIYDGVDVLSVSIGGDSTNYFDDGIAIGAFHAILNGISVVASAGNSGPDLGTVTNMAPWLLTVGASTIDRDFPAYVIFGKHKLKGQSLSDASLPRNEMLPLIRSRDAAAANASYEDANVCLMGSLDATKVRGKIVVCVRGWNYATDKSVAVKLVGGKGMVLVNSLTHGNDIFAGLHVLPAIHISDFDALKLFSYLNSTKSPMGTISYPITMLGTKPAPLMAQFSSQGPNAITPEILKPDIIAPGVNIIAAYTMATSLTGNEFDKRRLPFNILSGTSMSCPHIAGIVSLLKALHPEWSPSAIKSAIMTTASLLDNMAEPIKNPFIVNVSPFSYGSGHVWPSQAMDPGLVYDLNAMDYLSFLCSLGYNSSQISTFEPYECTSNLTSLMDLNYPSITVPSLKEPVTVIRRLKNVGSPGTYVAHVRNPVGVTVTIHPKTIIFERVGEEKGFEIKLMPNGGSEQNDYVFGSLEWSDGKHIVRSPITVKFKGH